MSGSSSSSPTLGDAHFSGSQFLGADFSDVVCVYRPDAVTGRLESVAAQRGMALQTGDIVSASAYTTGVDVHFGDSSQTLLGRGLMAHELTHTVQQQGAVPSFTPVNNAYLPPGGDE
jgi:hypothetical protein